MVFLSLYRLDKKELNNIDIVLITTYLESGKKYLTINFDCGSFKLNIDKLTCQKCQERKLKNDYSTFIHIN